MLSHRLDKARIWLRAIDRSSIRHGDSVQQRAFTKHTRLYLINRSSIRPQLPYLAQPSHNLRRLSPIDQQLLRLLSTETRKVVKDYAWLTIKWTALTWTVLGLLNLTWLGLGIVRLEQAAPTPEEWSFMPRHAVREAQELIRYGKTQGWINWSAVGKRYLLALQYLEDPTEDGKGTHKQEDEQDGGTIMIANVGSVGLDISEKSWPWRQGYFQVLMGMARASENMEDMVKDTTRNLIFPKSVMKGRSNPDPRPVNEKMASAPFEEDCVRPFDPPETFYMRILTGKGFTTLQKLESAWAFANWLEHSGLNDAAEEMYRWGVDIAKEHIPDSTNIVDAKTFVIKSTAPPTSNLLRALTLLGVHRARTGDASSALAILLSVLRARHDAPFDPSPVILPSHQSATPPATDIEAFTNTIRSLFRQKGFPEQPPTGDDAFVQRPGASECEDSELMLYVGEIMFAATPHGAEGLRWTKRAVDLTQNVVATSSHFTPTDEKTLAKCRQCLRTGLLNWQDMLATLAAQQADQQNHTSWLDWRAWIGRASSNLPKDELIDSDLRRIAELQQFVARDQLEDDLYNSRISTPFGMFAG